MSVGVVLPVVPGILNSGRREQQQEPLFAAAAAAAAAVFSGRCRFSTRRVTARTQAEAG